MRLMPRGGLPFVLAISALVGALSVGAPAAPKPTACKPHFIGQPEGAMLDDGRLFKLSRPYTFIDETCREWTVPATTTVDGATIPPILWSGVGGPFEGKYRNASIIHDWFCDRRTRPWQQVHKMFRSAMLANGVEPIKANYMYFAVYYGGPRWSTATMRNNLIAIGSCRACASVGGGGGGDSFAIKSKASAASLQLVFDHTKPTISEVTLRSFAAKRDAGEEMTPETVEAFVDAVRPKVQACPSGFRLAGAERICEVQP